MKIVIYGLAKSGTTALFYKIKNALPRETVCLFEPSGFQPEVEKRGTIRSLLACRRYFRGLPSATSGPGSQNQEDRQGEGPYVLAKVLPFRPNHPVDLASFSHFEKQILIVRDPRDRIVSRFLYGAYDSNFIERDDKVKAFLEILRQKECDPASISMKTLLQTFAQLAEGEFSFDEWAAAHRLHSIRRPLEFADARPELCLFRYEDLVDCRFHGLEEYLGRALGGQADVAREHGRVTRTKSYGAWRDWFTPEDIEYLRPILQPFLNRYYPKADWELNQAPLITAEFCSDYVKRLVNERRTFRKLPALV